MSEVKSLLDVLRSAEVTKEILKYLPQEDLLRLRCVNRKSQEIIDDYIADIAVIEATVSRLDSFIEKIEDKPIVRNEEGSTPKRRSYKVILCIDIFPDEDDWKQLNKLIQRKYIKIIGINLELANKPVWIKSLGFCHELQDLKIPLQLIHQSIPIQNLTALEIHQTTGTIFRSDYAETLTGLLPRCRKLKSLDISSLTIPFPFSIAFSQTIQDLSIQSGTRLWNKLETLTLKSLKISKIGDLEGFEFFNLLNTQKMTLERLSIDILPPYIHHTWPLMEKLTYLMMDHYTGTLDVFSIEKFPSLFELDLHLGKPISDTQHKTKISNVKKLVLSGFYEKLDLIEYFQNVKHIALHVENDINQFLEKASAISTLESVQLLIDVESENPEGTVIKGLSLLKDIKRLGISCPEGKQKLDFKNLLPTLSAFGSLSNVTLQNFQDVDVRKLNNQNEKLKIINLWQCLLSEQILTNELERLYITIRK